MVDIFLHLHSTFALGSGRKALPLIFPWVWGFVVLNMTVPISTTHNRSGLHSLRVFSVPHIAVTGFLTLGLPVAWFLCLLIYVFSFINGFIHFWEFHTWALHLHHWSFLFPIQLLYPSKFLMSSLIIIITCKHTCIYNLLSLFSFVWTYAYIQG